MVKETTNELKDKIVSGVRKGYSLDLIQDALDLGDKTMLWYLEELVREGRLVVSVT